LDGLDPDDDEDDLDDEDASDNKPAAKATNIIKFPKR